MINSPLEQFQILPLLKPGLIIIFTFSSYIIMQILVLSSFKGFGVPSQKRKTAFNVPVGAPVDPEIVERVHNWTQIVIKEVENQKTYKTLGDVYNQIESPGNTQTFPTWDNVQSQIDILASGVRDQTNPLLELAYQTQVKFMCAIFDYVGTKGTDDETLQKDFGTVLEDVIKNISETYPENSTELKITILNYVANNLVDITTTVVDVIVKLFFKSG